ncbi:MAG: hypothetical protein R3318_00355 [Gammaproteobacteria bacterium]|nr:hypothetical protein [Gammaproteobacteria bacterium]
MSFMPTPVNTAITAHAQKGVALMALILVIITGTSFMLVSKLNINLVDRENIQETYQSLEKAKQALIAYSLTVPERSSASPRPGPGYLPCPDTNNDGTADTPCAANSIGRLPYATLEEEMLLDDSGEVLWYALSNNFRFNPVPFTPMNSETAGQLTLDGQGDIVAVIFAPGVAFNNQQRNIAPNAAANYLENDNSNGDASFISYLVNDNPPTFNDRVIAITRQELMAAVEKRVLHEVDVTFVNYRNSFGPGNEAFPWLSPFVDPTLSTYTGLPGTSSGHLPVHITGQAYPNQSPMSATWAGLAGGAYVPTGANPPPEICLRNSACNDPNLGVNDPLVFSNAPPPSCTWSDPLTFNCTGTIVLNGFLCHTITIPLVGTVCVPYQPLTRTFSYTLNHTDDGTGVTTNPDVAALPRTRDLDTGGVDLLTGTFSIRAVDVGGAPIIALCNFIIIYDVAFICPPAGERGRATLTMNPGDSGDMTLAGVDFHLDANGLNLNPGTGAGQDNDYTDAGEIAPELPPWILNNNWHHLVYLAYPAVEPVPGNNAVTCTPGLDCLSVNAIATIAQNNVRALAVIAGRDLNTPTVRPSGILNNYLELDNFDLDTVYDRQVLSNVFNDYLRIINP